MSYLIINKKNMFAKFEFIAWLVEKWEMVFTYEETKPKVIKKELFEDVDFGSKPNPLLEKRQYKTKYGYKDKEYGSWAKRFWSSKREFWGDRDYTSEKKEFWTRDATYTPAYKRDKFKSSWPVRTTNKKGNTGMGYKVARKK